MKLIAKEEKVEISSKQHQVEQSNSKYYKYMAATDKDKQVSAD